MVTDVREEQYSKASFPMDAHLEPPSNKTDCREKHQEKAYSSMEVTEEGIVTDLRVHSEKAPNPMEVTGLPLKTDGITTSALEPLYSLTA